MDIIHKFPTVSQTRLVRGVCPVCGKSSTRRARWEHSINPYNRNADGSVKTAAQVREDVQREAADWEPDFTHEKCASR